MSREAISDSAGEGRRANRKASMIVIIPGSFVWFPEKIGRSRKMDKRFSGRWMRVQEKAILKGIRYAGKFPDPMQQYEKEI